MPRLLDNCLHCRFIDAIADYNYELEDGEILAAVLHLLKDCLVMDPRYQTEATIRVQIDLKAHRDALLRAESELKRADEMAKNPPTSGRVQ